MTARSSLPHRALAAAPAGLYVPALSPDGESVVFVAQDESGVPFLRIRSLSSIGTRKLSGTEGAAAPFWSADGQYIAFFSGGRLKKLAVAGGPAEDICESGSGLGGTWNGDGDIVFAPLNLGPLHRI